MRRDNVALLFYEQDGICFYCGRECILGERKKNTYLGEDRATIDHKHPKSRGGVNDRSNLVMACYRCNTIKSNKSFYWFRDSIQLLGPEEFFSVMTLKKAMATADRRRRKNQKKRAKKDLKIRNERIVALAILLYAIDRWPQQPEPIQFQMQLAA